MADSENFVFFFSESNQKKHQSLHKAFEFPVEAIKFTLKKIDNSFGFSLYKSNAHFLGNIKKGGAADIAGVRECDQIVEINGNSIKNIDFGKVGIMFLTVFCLLILLDLMG